MSLVHIVSYWYAILQHNELTCEFVNEISCPDQLIDELSNIITLYGTMECMDTMSL